MNNLEIANKYWEEKEDQVWNIAQKEGLDSALEYHLDTLDNFLFDLFDCGSYEPSEDEIIEAIYEVITQ